MLVNQINHDRTPYTTFYLAKESATSVKISLEAVLVLESWSFAFHFELDIISMHFWILNLQVNV